MCGCSKEGGGGGIEMKKRKAESSMPEDSVTYGNFCRAANSIAQLYTSGLHQQKVSYAAGQRDGLEKVMSYVLREHGTAAEISTAQLVAHLRRELHALNATRNHAAATGAATPGAAGGLDSRVIAHNTGRLLRGERGAFFAGALNSPARRALPHVAKLAPHTDTPPQFGTQQQRVASPLGSDGAAATACGESGESPDGGFAGLNASAHRMQLEGDDDDTDEVEEEEEEEEEEVKVVDDDGEHSHFANKNAADENVGGGVQYGSWR